MGYVDDGGKDADLSPLLEMIVAVGIAFVMGALAVLFCFALDRLIGYPRVSDRLRATATHQTLAFPLPVVAQPPTFAETVQVHASAMRTAELAAAVESRKAALLAAEGRELDLLIIVEAPSEMSADEVADQAAEMANRLRCKIKVQFQGRKVQARPGMSRKSFVKQATGFSADDGVCLAIVATALVGLAIVFSIERPKARRERNGIHHLRRRRP
jgi:hypothetical protein